MKPTSGPTFTHPPMCRECRRRHDAAMSRYREEFRAWLRARRAEAAEHARELAQLPLDERRAVRAAESRAARVAVATRVAARAARRVVEAAR
jgi:hypothetical protein